MGLFRMESRVAFRSRHLSIDTRVRVQWVTRRRREVAPDLAAELAIYTSESDLQDIAAMLDRYPDEDTEEMRSILAGQAARRLR